MDPILALLCMTLGAPTTLLMGGDVSMLARNEELGAVYRIDGQPRPSLELLRASGWNCLRLRLFVAPDGRGGVVQDLPYTIALAQRIRQAGFQLLLDLHYSDTWADPQKQTKPAAWRDLPFDQLVAKVESYTAEVMAALRAAGVTPEYVQVGNEITPGLLWPDGRSDHADAFGALLRAGVRGVKRDAVAGEQVRIVIHADCGGDAGRTRWFYDRVLAQQVPFDVIGLSYYPWWHGPLDKLTANMSACAKAYGRPVWVVETAYPYTNPEYWDKQPNVPWPISPEGQSHFLTDLAAAVRAVPDGLGLGVLYWFPESVALPNQYTWNGGATALFDHEGNRLPGALALHP